MLGVNNWIGYYPTVGALVDAATGREPVPLGGIAAIRASRLRGQIPQGGRAFVLPRSAGDSFRARTEYVWLPPAWFDHGDHSFDVVVLIPGVINTPRDWIVSGGAIDSAQDWARRHSGRAPILVFADPSGALSNDTECVNGPRGRAETHLTTEMVRRLDSALADGRPRDLVVAGWSMGGTCAMTLAARHRQLFPRFISISGDPRPSVVGGPSATTRELFAGRRDALQQHSIVTLATAMPAGSVAGFLAASYRRGTPPGRSKEVQTVQMVSSALGRTRQVATTVVKPG
ncbi:hypothetical protein GCM10007298_04200 [Williamsia phyllosphaerae]|uniref:Uncharacterized protein n=2 Tax=Williamsia phyllosphaerae TaxID=885042 RepID=A0ABQ1U5M6_9NOCA|nr:hypothetical protein GCM10007298_04200 [Williamsia phyllosphaerae]